MIGIKNSQFFRMASETTNQSSSQTKTRFEEVFYVLLLDGFDGGARLRVRIDALREVLLQSLVHRLSL